MSDRAIHLVLLEFADRSRASDHLDGHNEWIRQGFDDETFVLAGSVPGRGGVVLVDEHDRSEVDRRIGADPFVEHGVVTPTVIEIVPSRVAPALQKLLAP